MVEQTQSKIKKHKEILNFVKQFRDLGATECFTSGMCYWFAKILIDRFEEGEIVYNQIDNHFAALLYSTFRVYDITGDVTDKCDWEEFELLEFADPLLYSRLQRDCVFKLPREE